MIAPEALMEAVRDVVGITILDIGFEAGNELAMDVPAARIADVMKRLRDDPRTAMAQLVDVCGVDYPVREERFDVIYQLLSLRHNARLRVRVVVGEGQEVPTVTEVYPSAGWFEREAFDLFGIVFSGHPDLRRILTDYGFEGHPLRRDFPLTGFTQKRYDDLKRAVVDEPVALEQDYRAFDAMSPWRGLTDVQKRGGGQ